MFSLDFSKKMYVGVILCLSLFSMFFGNIFSLFFVGEVDFNGIIMVLLIVSGIMLIPLNRFLQKRFDISWGKYAAFMFTSRLMILIVSVSVPLVIRYFYQPFMVSGQSMSPSYYDDEYLIIQKTKNIKRGDVVIFETERKEFFLKRVIATPGDEIRIFRGEVFLKEKGGDSFEKLEEEYLGIENKGNTYVNRSTQRKTYGLGEGEYFLMGDNRTHSTDSRSCFGFCENKGDEFIKAENIIGKVVLDLGYFDFKRFQFFHPNYGIDTTPRYFDVK